MHLLNTTGGEISDGGEAIDLKQSPGDLVVLSAADSDLACLSRAAAMRPVGAPSVRLANLLRLKHPLSVDLYVERTVGKARFVCIRLIGGRGYWPYGLEEIHRVCRDRGIQLAVLLEEREDPDGQALSTVGAAARDRIGAYLQHGGIDNAGQLLAYGAALAGLGGSWREPAPLLEAGLYWPGERAPTLAEFKRRWHEGAPVAALLFYRALVASGGTRAVDAMIDALRARGINPLPVHLHSLKNPFAIALLRGLFAEVKPDVILNATGFATSSPGARSGGGPLAEPDVPVLQLVFAATSRGAWEASSRGLSARDLAMNVAMPEIDGRLFAGAVAFKAEARYDAATECPLVGHDPDPNGIAFAAEMAANWARLRRTKANERKVALILANYPNRDGRLGNGVGLDTPASAAAMLQAMKGAGYDVGAVPESGKALIERLRAGTTNAEQRGTGEILPLADYQAFLARTVVGDRVTERWGAAEADPFFDKQAGGFRLPLHRFGKVAVGVQPARGYNIDPKTSYHDPALPPPHGYLAFYAWLRTRFGVQAVIHAGKHGNLEWLPGKALALSPGCFPQAIAGPVPQLYPFIVNDPGEGTQAKRRIGAAIIDHLTPPLTRAESYGPLKALEALVDEYYLAAGLDPRRRDVLRDDILDLARSIGLDADCGMAKQDEESALAALDNYLCDLKEMQIRDGLHVFGASPEGPLRTDLLVALLRVPRRAGERGDASLLRALARDLGLAFDPLDCVMGDEWTGPKPAILAEIDTQPWRSTGDTVERLELLAQSLVSGTITAPADWIATEPVLATLQTLSDDVDSCGEAEMAALLRGLDGRFVPPGPSGAPTRGRPEVLPTGRNFYSVDTRAVPTPSAWHLGWKSAQLLIEEHLQRHGDYPKAMALTAWGTANMRTGGDDIAQALALMGARPTWESSTGRVTGFEILPATVLDRPRVDVTLRISGFFRDAFAEQIDLLASAASAVMRLDEPATINPAAARFRSEGDELRIFGARPGAYGAGLQAMIDEKLWGKAGDLAEAYLLWGSYGYGGGREGAASRASLERRLSQVDAVVQNQDNREHDLLDSDDYYQFEGGMTAAVTQLKGSAPAVYHNDHSRPESPKIRSLDEEIARVVRARLVNPKWIAGVMRHGYKGAFEIAASVDYLFAFAATTGLVRDHHFDLVFDAFIADDRVRDFLRAENPDALRETAARLAEAIERALWRPKSNSAGATLAHLSQEEVR